MAAAKASTILTLGTLIFTSCKKTDYLNVMATDRPPLAAKISFVNARPVDQGINFLTYTTQVNSAPVAMNKATPYMDAQFGLVQINIQAAGNTSYLASRVFGGAATFSSTGGPNGPIAGYNHTVFAARASAGNFTTDSLILFFDDLSAPAAGMAKFRFVHLTPNLGPVDIAIGSKSIFTNVKYGYAGGAVLSGTGLNAFSIGPFFTIPAASSNAVITSTTTGSPINIKDAKIDNITFVAGKAYTIFISGNPGGEVVANVLQHN
jgi:hypothetical protein